MYIDSSALVSVVVAEDDSEELLASMGRTRNLVTSAVTQVEASIAAGRYHDRDYRFGASQVADFLDRAEIAVLDVPGDLVGRVARLSTLWSRHRAQGETEFR